MDRRGYSRQEALEILQSTFDFKGEENHFVLRRGASQSFGQTASAGEQSFLATLKHPSKEIGLADMFEHLTVLFEVVMNEISKEYGDKGWARVFVSHPPSGENFIVKPMPVAEMTADFIMDVITKQINSADFVPCDEDLSIYVAAVKNIRGKGYKNIHNLQRDKRLKRSIIAINNEDNLCLPRAIAVGYALLLKREAVASADKQTQKVLSNRYAYLRKNKSPQQKKKAQELLRNVGLPLDHVGALADIPKFEDFFQVSISVISLLRSAQPVYVGKEEYSERKIILLHTESSNPSQAGHFDLVTSLTGLFCRHYVCPDCFKSYNTRGRHSCKTTCEICGYEKCKQVTSTLCGLCNRMCRSASCLDRHQNGFIGATGKKVSPLCCQSWKCPDCQILIHDQHDSVRVQSHACGEVRCSGCCQYFLDKHLCHMRIPKASQETERLVFFDFECIQESGKHVPNLVVVQTSCASCEAKTFQEKVSCVQCGYRCSVCSTLEIPCTNRAECGLRRKIWKGVTCRDHFCSWLLSETNRNAKVFAHNAKGYDAYFILAYLRDQNIKPNQIIMNGAKIMYMKMGDALNVEVLDSVNFLPMPLASLPKSFGLTELKKGFFPYLFNTEENQNKILPHLPDMCFYNPDNMYSERRLEFFKWYGENKHEVFDFQKEMLDYCISDVTILQEACMKFRQLVLKETARPVLHNSKLLTRKGVDPFSYITIASLCLGIVRRKFLPEEHSVLLSRNASDNCTHQHVCECVWTVGRKLSEDHPLEVKSETGEWEIVDDSMIECDRFSSSPIGLIPQDEYGSKGRHSLMSLEWLQAVQFSLSSARIQHARNGGEHVVVFKNENGIVRYKLDGYYKLNGKEYALEFHGCVWHGCNRCFPTARHRKVLNGKSLAELYSETQLKEKRLRDMGYILSVMWQCEFTQMKAKNA